MSNKEVKVTITAIDEFSKTFEKLEDHILDFSEMSQKATKAFDDFANGFGGNKIGKMADELLRIGTAMTTLPGRIGLATKAIIELGKGYVKLYDASKKNFSANLETLGTVFGKITSAVTGAVSAVTGFISQVTGMDLSLSGIAQSAISFGDEIKRAFITAGGGSEELFNKMKGKAQEIGMQFGYSANEMAQGMQELASAGLEGEEVMLSLKAATALATSGNIDMARSAEILTNTMNAFGEKTFNEDTTMKYANVLAKVADKSATSIDMIGESFKNCASMAGLMGYSVEDVGVVTGLMGNQFIKSGSAGTALNNIMTRLASGNKNCLQAIEKYNLEGYKQKMLNGDLVGAMMELQQATKDLDPDQRALIANALAGQYGMKGLLAVMEATSEETKEFQNELKGAAQAEIMLEELSNTTSGKMRQLASVMGVVGTAIYDKFEAPIKKALDGAINFAKGLVKVGDDGYYVIKSLQELSDESRKWGESLNQGIQKAINGIKGFVTGGGLDNLLQIGTNIIQGICKGIQAKADDGTLKETFSAAIQKACKFISENSEAIGSAGRDILSALADAIKENEDVIKIALDDLMGIVTEWAKGGGEIVSAMGSFADTMINALIDQAIIKAKARAGEIWNAVMSAITTETGDGQPRQDKNQGPGIMDKILGDDTSYSNADKSVGDWGLKLGNKIRKIFTGKEVTQAAKDGGTSIGKNTTDQIKVTFDENGKPIVESATKTGEDAATGIQAALQSMDLNYLQSLGQEMTNVGTLTTELATDMSTSFTAIADSARSQFTNLANICRNQMLNMSNIAKNQMVNIANAIRTNMVNASNIVKNQGTNMANSIRTSFVNMTNIARNQFVNMANICRNQMTNCANIVRNQMLNMTNIVKNQTTNMNNAVRTGFVNMANIVRNQMTNCTNIVRNQSSNMSTALSQGMSKMASAATSAMARVVAAVRSGMAQARAIASAPITINIQSNISRKVTTTHVAGGLKQTMSGIAVSTLSVPRPSTMANGTSGASIHNIPTRDREFAFTIPLMIDGREIAKATARYNEKELNKLEKRNSRRRGE